MGEGQGGGHRTPNHTLSSSVCLSLPPMVSSLVSYCPLLCLSATAPWPGTYFQCSQYVPPALSHSFCAAANTFHVLGVAACVVRQLRKPSPWRQPSTDCRGPVDRRTPSDGRFCVLPTGLNGLQPNTLDEGPRRCTLRLNCPPSITFLGGSQLSYLSQGPSEGSLCPWPSAVSLAPVGRMASVSLPREREGQHPWSPEGKVTIQPAQLGDRPHVAAWAVPLETFLPSLTTTLQGT